MPRIPATTRTTSKDTMRIYYANVGRMGTTNRDASLLTVTKRNVAMNTYATSWKAATVSAASPNAALAAPAFTGAEGVSQIRLGCQDCTNVSNYGTDSNVGPYAFGRGPNRSTSSR